MGLYSHCLRMKWKLNFPLNNLTCSHTQHTTRITFWINIFLLQTCTTFKVKLHCKSLLIITFTIPIIITIFIFTFIWFALYFIITFPIPFQAVSIIFCLLFFSHFLPNLFQSLYTFQFAHFKVAFFCFTEQHCHLQHSNSLIFYWIIACYIFDIKYKYWRKDEKSKENKSCSSSFISICCSLFKWYRNLAHLPCIDVLVAQRLPM